jgi:hypothetical protein
MYQKLVEATFDTYFGQLTCACPRCHPFFFISLSLSLDIFCVDPLSIPWL